MSSAPSQSEGGSGFDTYEAQIPIWGYDKRNNLGRTQNVGVTYTHTFSPTIVNELRGGWYRFNEAEVFGTTNDANFDVVDKMNLPLVSRLPEEYGPPTISLSGPEGSFSVYNCNGRSARASVPTRLRRQQTPVLAIRQTLSADRRGHSPALCHLRPGPRAPRQLHL